MAWVVDDRPTNVGDRLLFGDGKYALVEELVVDCAQAQAVVHSVGSPEGSPPYVCRVESDRRAVVEPAVVAAEGALVFVCAQDVPPKSRIPAPGRNHKPVRRACLEGLQVELDLVTDIGVEGWFEVVVQDHMGEAGG